MIFRLITAALITLTVISNARSQEEVSRFIRDAHRTMNAVFDTPWCLTQINNLTFIEEFK